MVSLGNRYVCSSLGGTTDGTAMIATVGVALNIMTMIKDANDADDDIMTLCHHHDQHHHITI